MAAKIGLIEQAPPGASWSTQSTSRLRCCAFHVFPKSTAWSLGTGHWIIAGFQGLGPNKAVCRPLHTLLGQLRLHFPCVAVKLQRSLTLGEIDQIWVCLSEGKKSTPGNTLLEAGFKRPCAQAVVLVLILSWA